MIIWINGAFGAGKTQTAFELHRRMPNSYVFDPEHAGYYIRRNIPKSIAKGDFQHYPMWRDFNYEMLSYIHREYAGTILVPMTVVDPVYFGEMVGRLREEGVVVYHFALCASKETIKRRLRKRGERQGSWAEQQIDRCVDGLSQELFRHHLDTDQMSIEAVAEQIAAMADVMLQPDHGGKWAKKWSRLRTQIRHIRFFS